MGFLFNFLSVILFSVISIRLTNAASTVIACKNENGHNVDWFYAYKLPKHKAKATNKRTGLEFLFITSTSESNEWTVSEQQIDKRESLIGQTITQAFIPKNRNDRLIVAYNDEPPNNKTDSSGGHTKGVLVANSRTGFWLIHSVPLFPEISDNPDEYSYPATGLNYGQSFLCISLKSSEIDKVGMQLLYNEPHIYYYKISDALRQKYPNISHAINKDTAANQNSNWQELNIQSANGIVFKSFAKNHKFHKELYEDWVAPVLQTDLYAETWRHGTGNIPSNCTQKFRVWNISQVNIHQLSFNTTHDHSKWAVGNDQTNWICIGDINRAEHQKQRGGGTVCQQSDTIATAYRNTIESFEPCERQRWN